MLVANLNDGCDTAVAEAKKLKLIKTGNKIVTITSTGEGTPSE